MAHPHKASAHSSSRDKMRRIAGKGGGGSPFGGMSPFKRANKDGEQESYNGHSKGYENGYAHGGKVKARADRRATGGKTESPKPSVDDSGWYMHFGSKQPSKKAKGGAIGDSWKDLGEQPAFGDKIENDNQRKLKGPKRKSFTNPKVNEVGEAKEGRRGEFAKGGRAKRDDGGRLTGKSIPGGYMDSGATGGGNLPVDQRPIDSSQRYNPGDNYAKGGRAKHKGDVNIAIVQPQHHPRPMMPPMAPGAAMGAGAPPPPPAGAPPGGAAANPQAMQALSQIAGGGGGGGGGKLPFAAGGSVGEMPDKEKHWAKYAEQNKKSGRGATGESREHDLATPVKRARGGRANMTAGQATGPGRLENAEWVKRS